MTDDTRPKSLSLGLVLIVPYVTLVIGLAIAVGALSYHAGSRGISTVSELLLLETVGRIGQAVDRHIIGSGAVLESAFPEGMAAPPNIESDLDELRTRFWIATSLHIDPNNYVYYGNEAGQGLGLYRPSLERGELRMKLRAEERRAYYRFEGIAGPLEFVSRETRLFDPRTRPWYKDGKNRKGHTWTSVYIDFGTQELVATRARHVLSPNGDFDGVVATDVSLKALNDFIGRLSVSPNGVAFIIEPDGQLIASSSSPNVVRLPDGGYGRIGAADSGHALLSATYRALRERLDRNGLPARAQVLSFEAPEGETIHAAFDRVKDDAGLEWITVVSMPASDFMAGVTHNLNRTIVLGSTAVLLTILIGLGIFGWVARDLRRLSEAARKVGDGELDTPVGIRRRDEIGALARSFEDMQRRLRTDRLTGLTNREGLLQQLRSRIRQCTLDRRRGGLAVLFIDLNRFKQINDSFGHETGDRALQEVAQRLRGSVRADDLVARYAGDEFVILLEDIDDDAVAHVRATIERVLSEPLRAVGTAKDVSVGAAIGVAVFPDNGGDAESLLKCADRRMYDEKFRGRSPEQLEGPPPACG